MTNTAFVKVLNAANELPVKLGSLGLVKTGVSHNKIEQLTSVCVLHDHEKLLLSLNNLVELNDIRMANLLQNFDLPSDTLHVFLIVDLLLL